MLRFDYFFGGVATNVLGEANKFILKHPDSVLISTFALMILEPSFVEGDAIISTTLDGQSECYTQACVKATIAEAVCMNSKTSFVVIGCTIQQSYMIGQIEVLKSLGYTIYSHYIHTSLCKELKNMIVINNEGVIYLDASTVTMIHNIVKNNFKTYKKISDNFTIKNL